MLSVTVIRGLLIPSQLCSCCCPWPSVPNLEYWIALPFVFSGRLLDQEFSSDRSVHRSKSIQLILDSADPPPSTTSAAPVIKEESSDARNSAAFAISSAVPIRPSGRLAQPAR